MRLQNRNGTAVDAVPFLVVTATAFLLTFSFGPPYGTALGVSLDAAIAGSAVAYLLTTGLAYHRLVWRATPELREEIPASLRYRTLLYIGVGLGLILILLSLPLLPRTFR